MQNSPDIILTFNTRSNKLDMDVHSSIHPEDSFEAFQEIAKQLWLAAIQIGSKELNMHGIQRTMEMLNIPEKIVIRPHDKFVDAGGSYTVPSDVLPHNGRIHKLQPENKQQA